VPAPAPIAAGKRPDPPRSCLIVDAVATVVRVARDPGIGIEPDEEQLSQYRTA